MFIWFKICYVEFGFGTLCDLRFLLLSFRFGLTATKVLDVQWLDKVSAPALLTAGPPGGWVLVASLVFSLVVSLAFSLVFSLVVSLVASLVASLVDDVWSPGASPDASGFLGHFLVLGTTMGFSCVKFLMASLVGTLSHRSLENKEGGGSKRTVRWAQGYIKNNEFVT